MRRGHCPLQIIIFLRGKWKLIDLSITNTQKTKKQTRLSKTSCSMSYTGLHLPSIFMISAVATSLPLRGAQAWICKIFLIIHTHNVIITQYIMSGTFTFTLWPPCPSTQVLTDLCKYVCKLQDLDFIQPTFGRVELNINHHSYGLRRRELICNLFYYY